MTIKEQRFVNGVVESISTSGKSLTQIAKDAGYSEKTAKDIASENLAKPHLKSAIALQLDKIGLTDEFLDQHAKMALQSSRESGKYTDSYQYWRDIQKMKGRLKERTENVNLNIDMGTDWLENSLKKDEKIA